MSRRTRIKLRKNQDHFGLGTSHHGEYASSTSYFPKSYSALGKEIRFPSTAVPFLSDGKITFYGSLEGFQTKFLALDQEELESIHTVNVGIRGNIEQQMSPVNHCIFAFSMVVCCVSQIFATSLYRDKCFVKYSFDIKDYSKIIEQLKVIPNLQTVMFTFQDNYLNQQKLQMLDENLSRLKLNSVTLRNLSYFIWPGGKIKMSEEGIEDFEKIKKSRMQFIFVWEKFNMKYNSRELQEEKQSIAASLCDEL